MQSVARSSFGFRALQGACIAFLVIAFAAIAIVPSEAHAATKTKEFSVDTWSNKSFSTSGFDLNKDGKRDTFTVKIISNGTDYANKARVYINGKLASTIKQRYSFYGVRGKIMIAKNKRAFIYIHPFTDNDDGSNYMFTWKNGGLKRIADFSDTCYYVSGHNYAVPTIKGNSFVVDHSFMSNGTGALNTKFTYKYRNGKLKRTSTVGPYVGSYYNGNDKNRVLHANKTLQVYSGKTCKYPKFKLSYSQMVTATKIFVSGKQCAIKIKTASGQSGWVKVGDKYPRTSQPLFKELYWAG